jgi:hypothetical protein
MKEILTFTIAEPNKKKARCQALWRYSLFDFVPR